MPREGIPAFAGMTGVGAGMTGVGAGMTWMVGNDVDGCGNDGRGCGSSRVRARVLVACCCTVLHCVALCRNLSNSADCEFGIVSLGTLRLGVE